MKEIRCRGAFKAWRIAFIFTPERSALLLVAGGKSGMKSKLFYGRLIKTADKRFDQFLNEPKADDSASTVLIFPEAQLRGNVAEGKSREQRRNHENRKL